MAQRIKQGNIFGRIGTEVGRGLAESIPKEVERSRLAAGLKDLENQPDLTPFQQFARLTSIPGITPQAIQSGAELLKQQNTGNAFKRAAAKGGSVSSSAQPYESQVPVPVGQLPEAQTQLSQGSNQGSTQGGQPRTAYVKPDEVKPREVVETNPLDQKYLPRTPWTPSQRAQAISDYSELGFTPEQSSSLASKDEQAYLAEPEIYQQQQEYLRSERGKLHTELDKQLSTKLQKETGSEQYKDLSGEMLSNLRRGAERDLRERPGSTVSSVANDWSNRALNLAKAKDQLKALAKTSGIENLWTGQKTLNKMKVYQDIYKKANNLEEFNNLLGDEFRLSPQGRASVAFPLNNQLKDYVNNYKPQTGLTIDSDKARKAAIDIEKHMNNDDSPLAIARALTDKDSYFDQEAFFEQLREDIDHSRFNERQRREIAQGAKDILPNWSDILYLPWIGGRKK